MKEFYITSHDPTEIDVAREVGFQNLMSSFYYGYYKQRLKRVPTGFGKVAIDSGAFASRRAPLSQTVYKKKYKKWLRVHREQYDWFVAIDFPTEFADTREAVEKTIEYAEEFTNFAEDYSLKKKLVTVLQGETVEDYLYCLEEFKKGGLLTERQAIGSLCIKDSYREVLNIVRAVKKRCEKKLHLFGQAIPILRDIHTLIYSTDSHAPFRLASFGEIAKYREKKLESVKKSDISWKEKHRISLKSYRQCLKDIEAQKNLMKFCNE